MNNVKIFVTFHKDYPIDEYISNKDIFVPIHAGKDLNNSPTEFLASLIGDNSGDNISSLNKNLNESTVIYWIGKHLQEFNDPDYVGLFHYRRFLKFDANDLDENRIFVNRYDFHGLPVYNQILFAETTPEILNTYINFYLMLNPNDTKLMKEFFQSTYLYTCNMFIMHKDIFSEYSRFFEQNIDICRLLLKHKFQWFNEKPRMLGMFLERMTGFFLFKMEKTGKNIVNCKLIGEQNK